MHEALKREFQNALRDRFEIIREIGRGAYGTVYLARDKHERDVALKVLDPEIVRGSTARILRECRIVARLVHPHILPLLEADEVAGLLYYSTPYVSGGSLSTTLLHRGPLHAAEAIRIAEQVADALTYAHTHDVLHRDIKPGNVLFDGETALVKDFWIARAFSVALHERITAEALVLGTPEYMSPEEMADRPVDARSDVYALAVLICAMLTSRFPFPVTPAEMVRQKLSRGPRLADLPPGIPPQLAKILLRALAQHPDDRFPRPQDLIAECRAVFPPASVQQGVKLSRSTFTAPLGQTADVEPSPVQRLRRRAARPTKKMLGVGTLATSLLLLAATGILGLEPRMLYTFGALGLSLAGLVLTFPRNSSSKPPPLASVRAPTDLEDRLRGALKYQYEITREVGHGGMALVYLARDLRYRRRSVAIKVMRPEVAIGIGFEKFMEEIEIMAQLAHPGILPVLDYGDADGLPFYVMPFVAGQSVKSHLDQGGPLPIALALSVTRDVGRALDYAHRKGIIHRDIKPENILFFEGQAILADFGIARAVDRSRRGTTKHIRLGTPEFMSPEQFWDTKHIDRRSDVYSLGCVLFEILTGKPPYEGSPHELAVKHLKDPIPHVRAYRTDVPELIDGVICRALAKEQDDRFESAAAFVAALD